MFTCMPSGARSLNSRLVSAGAAPTLLTPATLSAALRAMAARTSGETVVLPGGRLSSDMVRLLRGPSGSHHRHAAVHTQHLAGDERSLVGSQEGSRVGDLNGQALSSQ